MANVKITELVELAAVDIAGTDVLPIVDVSADSTKKVTIVSLRNYADANDYITYTTLNAAINNTQSNVNSAESNIIAYATQANINLDTKANVSATYFSALANDYSTYTVLVGSISNTNAYITTNYATQQQVNTVQTNVGSLSSSVGNLATLTTANKSNLVSAINEVNSKSYFNTARFVLQGATISNVSSVGAVIFSEAKANVHFAKLLINVEDLTYGQYQSSELLLVQDTADIKTVEYAMIYTSTNPIAAYEASIVGDNIQLFATAVSSDNIINVFKTIN
jgi:hypothetical protein